MVKQIKYYFQKLRLEDVKAVVLLCVTFFPAFLLKRQNIWVIGEREDSADDNGWYFYQWLKVNHPEQQAFFVLDKKANNFDKYDKNMIAWGSVKHYFLYWASRFHISTLFSSIRPNKRVCAIVEKIFRKKLNRIFLQHGIIKDSYEMFSYEKIGCRIFICGAYPEYEYLSKYAGYPKGYMQYTGLARFDDLMINKKRDGYILILPTWRRYIGYDIDKTKEENETDFLNSQYFLEYMELLNDQNFDFFLNKNNLKAKFCVHPMYKQYKHLFHSSSSCIEILENNESIHKLLMETDLLITDYSSVFFDAGYAEKPVVYFHFDYNEFRQKHFADGYFSYDNDGFGPIARTKQELMDAIISCEKDGLLVQKEKYSKRCKRFFLYHDTNNCSRIYDAVVGIYSDHEKR